MFEPPSNRRARAGAGDGAAAPSLRRGPRVAFVGYRGVGSQRTDPVSGLGIRWGMWPRGACGSSRALLLPDPAGKVGVFAGEGPDGRCLLMDFTARTASIALNNAVSRRVVSSAWACNRPKTAVMSVPSIKAPVPSVAYNHRSAVRTPIQSFPPGTWADATASEGSTVVVRCEHRGSGCWCSRPPPHSR